MEISELCKQAHTTAKEKGFYDRVNTFLDFAKQRQVGGMHKYILELEIIRRMDLIHGELGEALEALRKNNRGLCVKDTFEDEIADTFIRLGDMCDWLDIDIEKQIEWKMNFNATREKMHGKKF